MHCPVLVIAFEKDPVMPVEFSEDLVSCMPSALAELHVVPGRSHYDFQAIYSLSIVRDFIHAHADQDNAEASATLPDPDRQLGGAVDIAEPPLLPPASATDRRNSRGPVTTRPSQNKCL